MYLVAIIDMYNRGYNLRTESCKLALEDGILKYGTPSNIK